MTTPESLEVMLVSRRVDERDALRRSADRGHRRGARARRHRPRRAPDERDRAAGAACPDTTSSASGFSATVGNPDAILDVAAGHIATDRARRRPAEGAGAAADPRRAPPRPRGRSPTTAARVARGQKSLFFCQSRSTTEAVAEHMRRAGTDGVRPPQRGLSRGAPARRGALPPRHRRLHRLHVDARAGHRRRRPRPRAPGRSARHGELVPAAHGPNRPARGTDGEHDVLLRDDRGRAAGRSPSSSWRRPAGSKSVRGRAPLLAGARSTSSSRCRSRATAITAERRLGRTCHACPTSRASTGPSSTGSSNWMLRDGALRLACGRLVLGPKAERRFGRKNFMELFAVFSSPQTYTVQTADGQPLGSLNQAFVDRLVDGVSSFLLGGRAWAVVRVQHDDRLRGRRAGAARPAADLGRLPAAVPRLRGLPAHPAGAAGRRALSVPRRCRPRRCSRRAARPCASVLELHAGGSSSPTGRFAGGRSRAGASTRRLRYALEALGRDWKVIPDNFLDQGPRRAARPSTRFDDALARFAEPEFWENDRLWAGGRRVAAQLSPEQVPAADAAVGRAGGDRQLPARRRRRVAMAFRARRQPTSPARRHSQLRPQRRARRPSCDQSRSCPSCAGSKTDR